MQRKRYALYKEKELIGYHTEEEIRDMLGEKAQALMLMGINGKYTIESMRKFNGDGTYTITCLHCGKRFTSEIIRDLCPDCAVKSLRQRKQEANKRHNEKRRVQREQRYINAGKDETKKSELSEVAMQARNKGMSYGRYVASLQPIGRRMAKEILKNF